MCRHTITDLDEVSAKMLFTVALTVTCVRSILKAVFVPVTEVLSTRPFESKSIVH